MDGDEVASINDTVESKAVVSIIKDSYEYLISHTDLPEHKGFYKLESSDFGNMALKLPSTALTLEWLKYDCQLTSETLVRYTPLKQLSVKDFMDYTSQFSEFNANTESYTYDDGVTTLQFLAQNDAFPTRYTIVNDSVVLFDSYWNDEEGGLQASRTLGYGTLSLAFTEDDDFVLPIDEKQYTLLKNEAKSQAFIELKQAANPKAEQRARQGWIDVQHTKRVKGLPPMSLTPDYGRK